LKEASEILGDRACRPAVSRWRMPLIVVCDRRCGESGENKKRGDAGVQAEK